MFHGLYYFLIFVMSLLRKSFQFSIFTFQFSPFNFQFSPFNFQFSPFTFLKLLVYLVVRYDGNDGLAVRGAFMLRQGKQACHQVMHFRFGEVPALRNGRTLGQGLRNLSAPLCLRVGSSFAHLMNDVLKHRNRRLACQLCRQALD